MKKSVTLIELLIVLVVMGIIAGFAVPGYLGARNRAVEREAQAMLILIQTAEKVRLLETRAYVACADTGLCNTALDLDLPTQNYTYNVNVNGALFCAQGIGAGLTTFCIDGDSAQSRAGACNASVCP